MRIFTFDIMSEYTFNVSASQTDLYHKISLRIHATFPEFSKRSIFCSKQYINIFEYVKHKVDCFKVPI